MTLRAWTILILCLNAALLIGWDVFAVRRGGVEATISRVLYDAATTYPILPLLVGILLGHLFASQHFK